MYGESLGRQSHGISYAQRGARFVTQGDCDTSSTCELFPQDIASLANYPIEIGIGQRHGDGSCVSGGIDCQIGIFDDVSAIKAICTYFVMCQLFLDFSDQIVRQDYSSV